MLYNVRQPYTPPLAPYEFNRNSLIIDTETVGSGPEVEVVELALCDFDGCLVFDSLVRPTYNRLPRATREQRFEKSEFDEAPAWQDVWPLIAPLVHNKLLIAYNAAFDRRALSAMLSRHRQSSTERGWRCAMSMLKRGWGTARALTLTDACARLGLEGGNHRAAQDVLATHRLLTKAIARADRHA